ncbi:MAG: hypothetical protein IKR09_01295 [Alphaproteobacteria bacterium]|nr:hypothetical protein [Alphaproteobacteria bacterium]
MRIRSKEDAFFQNTFDIVISLGEDCGCASYLQEHQLRKFSGPFDWLTKASFNTRIECICNDFSEFLQKENMKIIPKNPSKTTDEKHDYYDDEKTDFYFYHDFDAGVSFDEMYSAVKEKYDRRIKRFYQVSSYANKILFVWFSRDKKIPDEDILRAHSRLKEKLLPHSIFLLVLENGKDSSALLSDSVLKIRYDNASFVNPAEEWRGNKEENDAVFSKIKISSKKYISDTDLISYMKKNKTYFDGLLGKEYPDEAGKIEALKNAAVWATYNPCGILKSARIENALCDIASNHHIDLPEDYIPNSVLHVASKIYILGGHSVVLDQWLNHHPDGQINSLALTWCMPEEHVLKTSVEAVKKSGGELYFLANENKDPMQIALRLRQIASKYEKIVLHIHMEDVIPLLAFGTPEFKRPVVFFNHSDHIFWLGASIADCVVSFREFAKELCITERGIISNQKRSLPVNAEKKIASEQEKAALRKSLSIPHDAKIVMTIARNVKFYPFNDLDYFDVAKQILEKTENVWFVVIGLSWNEATWSDIPEKLKERIRLLGVISRTDLDKYMTLADVALDSLPFSSTASFYELAFQNIPAFTLQTAMNHDDLNDAAGISCATPEELASKVISAVNSPRPDKCPAFSFLEQNNSSVVFQKKLKELYDNFPREHQVNKIIDIPDREITPVEKMTALNYFVEKSLNVKPLPTKTKTILEIPYVIKIWKVKTEKVKRVFLRLFGIKIRIFKKNIKRKS